MLLVLFFFLQVIDATMKQGVKAGLVLVFTSIVIFPIVCILEIVESTPRNPEGKQNDAEEFIISPKEMLILDGIVHHTRKEQAENSFNYHIRCALLNLDSTPDNFSGGLPTRLPPTRLPPSLSAVLPLQAAGR